MSNVARLVKQEVTRLDPVGSFASIAHKCEDAYSDRSAACSAPATSLPVFRRPAWPGRSMDGAIACMGVFS